MNRAYSLGHPASIPRATKNKGVGNLFSPPAITDALEAALDQVR